MASGFMNSMPISETIRRQPRVERGHRVGREDLVPGHPVDEHRGLLGPARIDPWISRILLSRSGTDVPSCGTSDRRPRAPSERFPHHDRTQTGTQAVDRAAELLVRVVEADGPVSFGAITEAAGLPKSTTSRLLGALERHALVERDRDGALRPGSVLTRYARRASATDQLVATARPFLEELGRSTGETVNLAVPGAGAVEQIDQVDSPLPARRDELGRASTCPFHCSALGKVFLAHRVVALPAGRRLEQRTDRTITTREALAAELRRGAAARLRGRRRGARARPGRRRRPGPRRGRARRRRGVGLRPVGAADRRPHRAGCAA